MSFKGWMDKQTVLHAYLGHYSALKGLYIWASPVGEAVSSPSADIPVHSLLPPSHRRGVEISQELSAYLWHECFNPYISFSVTSKFEVHLWVYSYMAVLERVDGILTFSTFRMNICMFIIWNSDLTGCFVFYHTTFPRGYQVTLCYFFFLKRDVYMSYICLLSCSTFIFFMAGLI